MLQVKSPEKKAKGGVFMPKFNTNKSQNPMEPQDLALSCYKTEKEKKSC